MKRNKLAVMFCLAATLLIAGCGDKQETGNTVNETKVVLENKAIAESESVEETKQEEITKVEESISSESEQIKEASVAEEATVLEDGQYLADFDTDSSMFHVNEVCDGKAVLTVENGQMKIHLIMPSKNVVNLFFGLAEDAEKEGADLIIPMLEEVLYPDGLTEEVHAFDVPVPVIGEEFDVALVGTKGKWYDHKVKVSDPEPFVE